MKEKPSHVWIKDGVLFHKTISLERKEWFLEQNRRKEHKNEVQDQQEG